MKSLLALLLVLMPAAGAAQQQLPPPLDQVGFDQHLGEKLPLELVFRDESGEVVHLAAYFGQRPVLLVLAYYECPMLCTLVLNGIVHSLRPLQFQPGREFEVVAVSIDPGETPTLAHRKKATAVKEYGRPETASGWHFLVGQQDQIDRLAEAVGFHYAYVPERDEYAHAAGVVLATPDGNIARYFYGIEYPPRDLRLGMVEASQNRIGSVVDQLLLYCYRYDPQIGRYSAVAMNVLRLVAGLFVVALGAFILAMRRREKNLQGTT